jgi:hypothetical protein
MTCSNSFRTTPPHKMTVCKECFGIPNRSGFFGAVGSKIERLAPQTAQKACGVGFGAGQVRLCKTNRPRPARSGMHGSTPLSQVLLVRPKGFQSFSFNTFL